MRNLIFSLHKTLFSVKKRIYRYALSDNKPISCGKIKQPTLFLGEGKIEIAPSATLGYFPSARFYSGYIHIEARSRDAKISIGEDSYLNNDAVLVAEKASIEIGARCFIGTNFHCMSSDFHGLDPHNRANYNSAPVKIGDDVFIGSDVTILKGVSIGDGATVAAGAVVTKSFPPNSIIAGNPARLIRIFDKEETSSLGDSQTNS